MQKQENRCRLHPLWRAHRHFLALFILWLPFLLHGYDYANELRFQHITVGNGLSQQSVHTILQDRYGYLWFGTRDGLNRYDGYNIRIYKSIPGDNNSLTDSSVISIYEDVCGNLWIGTENGLNRYDRPNDRFFQYQNITNSRESRESISRITTAPDGHTIIIEGNRTQVIGCNPDSLKFFNFQKRFFPQIKYPIDRFIFEKSGCVWFIHRVQTSIISDELQIERYNPRTGRSEDLSNPLGIYPIILDTNEDNDGNVWITTWKQGLLRFDTKTSRFTQYRGDPHDPNFPADIVTGILVDSDGQLWIGTWGSGLGRFNSITKRFTFYKHDLTISESLSHDNVKCIYQDNTGTIWVGTIGGGVNYFQKSDRYYTHLRTILTEPNSLSNNSVYSILKDHTGTLWIGTDGGGLNRFDPTTGIFTTYRHDDRNPASIASNTVVRLLEDSKGRLWVGNWFAGLDIMDRQRGTFKHIDHRYSKVSKEFAVSVVRSLLEDKRGMIWIGGENDGLFEYNPETETIRHFAVNPGDPGSLPSGTIHALAQDPDGSIWVGTERGLCRLEPISGKITRYSVPQSGFTGLGHDFIWDLHIDARGELWIGTNGDGLNRLDRASESFVRYTLNNDNAADVVYGILEDSKGCLWMSTTKGIFNFDPLTGKVIAYDVTSGLQGLEFNQGAFFRAADGEMFFGGNNGLNRFYPDRIRANTHVPSILITRFTVMGKSQYLDKFSHRTITLAHDENNLTFEFSALDFTAPYRNRYAYRLEPFDKSWNFCDAYQRVVHYTNLCPGVYTFRVKGSNNDGLWNEEGQSVRIVIRKPFWMMWWFYVLVTMGGVWSIYGIIRLRLRIIEAQKRHLEHIVQLRTDELQEQTERLNAIFNNALVGIVIVDEKGSPRYANRKWAEMLGTDNPLAYNLRGHIHEDDINEIQSLTLRCMSGEIDSFQSQTRFLSVNNRPFWANASCSILYDRVRNARSLIMVIADIDQQRRNEEMLKQVERRNASLAMAVTANHEINQPLTVLQGNVEMLLNKIHPDQGIERYTERIRESIDRISAILTKYRDFRNVSYDKYSEHTEMVVFAKELSSADDPGDE
jgi:PAS domain S-box-containing protein